MALTELKEPEKVNTVQLNFSPNTPQAREKLIPGKLYLTIYRNATSICRSIYRGDDHWQNPESYEIATNSVEFFASASVFNIPSFNGWKHLTESDESNTPKRWESVTHYVLMLKKDGTLQLFNSSENLVNTLYSINPYNYPTEWLSSDGKAKAELLQNGSVTLYNPGEPQYRAIFSPMTL